MKKLLTTAAVAATLALSTASAALAASVPVVFDFGKLATGNEGTWDSRSGTGTAGAGGVFSGGAWTLGGIGVVATASNSANANTPVSFAYLDGPTGAGPGGLGVCSSRITSGFQCGTAADDNTGLTGGGLSGGFFETVTLTFTKAVAITGLELRDREHRNLASALIGINGFDFLFGSTALSTLGVSNTFSFSRVANGQDFYLDIATVAPVPVPAALPLAMAAFGGLALLGRRRKAVA